MRGFVVVAAMVSLTGLAPPAFAAEPAAPSSVACQALEPVIAAYEAHAAKGEVLNFSGGQAVPMRDWGKAATASAGAAWRMSRPSAGALRRVSEVTPVNAMACPNFAQKARAMGRVLTDDERHALYTAKGGAKHRAWVQVISAPVINDAQNEALVRIRVQRNGLGQVENLYYLRKTQNGWRQAGERETPPEQLRPLG